MRRAPSRPEIGPKALLLTPCEAPSRLARVAARTAWTAGQDAATRRWLWRALALHLGLGLERLVAWLCGLKHVREAIPFPRLLDRLYP